MKKLQRFLLLVIFALLGACAFRSFAIYYDFIKHPELYEIQSAPWYTSILLNVSITGIVVVIIAIIYCIIGLLIKKQSRKSKK